MLFTHVLLTHTDNIKFVFPFAPWTDKSTQVCYKILHKITLYVLCFIL